MNTSDLKTVLDTIYSYRTNSCLHPFITLGIEWVLTFDKHFPWKRNELNFWLLMILPFNITQGLLTFQALPCFKTFDHFPCWFTISYNSLEQAVCCIETCKYTNMDSQSLGITVIYISYLKDKFYFFAWNTFLGKPILLDHMYDLYHL